MINNNNIDSNDEDNNLINKCMRGGRGGANVFIDDKHRRKRSYSQPLDHPFVITISPFC